MEEEPTLEVTDRRRVEANGGDAAEPPANAAVSAEGSAVSEEAGAPPMPPMDVYSLINTTIALLANGAWGWMGLTPNPFTGEMEKDLAQAKVAIDAVAALLDQVDARLSEEERRDARTLLSNLRVNYVQQAQAAS